MVKKILALAFGLVLLTGIAHAQDFIFNPNTGQMDYVLYNRARAAGDILYNDGTVWQVLNVGANGEVLTLAAGLPSWAAGGAPGAHAASHEVGGTDLVDHDQLTNYLAAQHLTLPNTIVAVLTDHNVGAHTSTIGGTGQNSSGWTGYPYVTAGTWAADTFLTKSGNNLQWGIGAAGIDYTMTFDGESNDGVITWMEDEDQFTMACDLDVSERFSTGSLTTPWTNVFVVDAGGGGDYTTVQAALTAQSAGGELFLITPGTYTGDTINFTANNQCVRGMGNVGQISVTAADAAIVDFGAFTNCRIELIQISMTAPTTAKDMITGSGSLYLRETDLVVTNTLVIGADQPTAIDTTGTVIMTRGQIVYDNSGDDGGGATAIKAAIRVSGTALVTLDRVMLDIDGSGQSLLITPAFGTAGDVNMYRCSLDINDDASTNTVGYVYTNIVGATHEFMGNDVHVDNSTNTAVGLIEYIGYALPRHQLRDKTCWGIIKCTYDANNRQITKYYANAEALMNKTWSLRATYTYT